MIVNNAFARAEQACNVSGGPCVALVRQLLEDEELQASIARETTEAELNDLRRSHQSERVLRYDAELLAPAVAVWKLLQDFI